MANINMDLHTICNLRKRQQLFAMPSFRATPISPYNGTVTQTQLDMRRKAEILKYAGNRMNTQTNSQTQQQRYNQVISGMYQSRPYITTYTDTVIYVYDKELDMEIPIITHTPVYSNPDPDCPLDDMIPVPTSSSDVPGPIIQLYNDTNIPLYNYNATMNNNIYAITDVVETNMFKLKYAEENTYGYVKIMTQDEDGISELKNEDGLRVLLCSIYITRVITRSIITYELAIPIGIHFVGTSKKKDNKNISGPITLSIDTEGFNPQVEFVGSLVSTERLVSFSQSTNNISITFNISDNKNDFSGTIYVGMLNITNIKLFSEPGYIYDINTDANIQFAIADNMRAAFLSQYDFKYGIYYNYSDATPIFSQENCTITSPTANDEPLLPFQVKDTSV